MATWTIEASNLEATDGVAREWDSDGLRLEVAAWRGDVEPNPESDDAWSLLLEVSGNRVVVESDEEESAA